MGKLREQERVCNKKGAAQRAGRPPRAWSKGMVLGGLLQQREQVRYYLPFAVFSEHLRLVRAVWGRLGTGWGEQAVIAFANATAAAH
ncbi:hypothetical protein [Vandammella animalimorsus]|uniref:hypothetical protein n=1 Tax=Vandammella animalimorsus TaxID=2029117 RepID=UPI00117DBE6D|nr:hypothetical protein [Vandammella animalimorsus]